MEPSDQAQLIKTKKRSSFAKRETRGLLAGIVRNDVEKIYDQLPKSRKKLPNILSLEDLDRIRNWIMVTFMDDPALQCLYRCIIELLWDGALRRGELIALRWECLQGNNLLIENVPDQFDQIWLKRLGVALKTGERLIPIAANTAQWVHRWRTEFRPTQAHKQGHGFLLTNLHPDRIGNPFSINSLKWLFNRLNHHEYGVGLSNQVIHPHVFRHTFATMALNEGVPITSIQFYLGHRSVSTTQIYAQLSDSKLRNDLQEWRSKNSYRYRGL
ncbi:tyrosine-type recombinase/integrase [Brevibacillus fortis]|uniref:tyrosine-type recombinase/integrase n=1 Tax=Brevibacillus fortis TaxID=2126352 RepID=UPI0038FD265A